MGKSQYVSKHVRETAVHGFPEPSGDQFVVKLIRSRGGNVMECENAEGTMVLCILPAKFSKVCVASNLPPIIFELSRLVNSGCVGSKR
jgi:hypothetical protein